MSRILIIDDEPAICWSLKERLTDQAHEVRVAASIERAEERLIDFVPDVLVLDVRLPGQDGLSAIPQFRQRFPQAPIIVMTAFGDLQTAVDAIGKGAFEYIVKPFDLTGFLSVVARAIQSTSGRPITLSETADSDQLVGRGPAMQAVFKQIALVASTDFPVLISGETGTGKELVAEAIHRHSQRHSGPFVRVSLASLNPSVIESELFGHVKGAYTGASDNRRGLFEQAENGTIFLDELGETPLAIQVKLLRILESRSYSQVGTSDERTTNARMLAATNRDLKSMIAEGRFREDLYHRLNVFEIDLPPLRNRREDLRPLVDYFYSRRSGVMNLVATDEFWSEIERRTWTGNIRELKNAIDRAVLVSRGGPLSIEHLPTPTELGTSALTDEQHLESAIAEWVRRQIGESGDQPLEDLHKRFLTLSEKALFDEVLSHTRQNRSAAAKLLGLDRTTLRNKLGSTTS